MVVDIDIEDELLGKAMNYAPAGITVDQLMDMALATFIEHRLARQRLQAEWAAPSSGDASQNH